MEGNLVDVVVQNMVGKGGNVDERDKGGNERKASLSPSKVEAAWGDEECDHEDGEGKENKLGRSRKKKLQGGRPWLLIGDFNCVLSVNEAMGSGSSDLLAVQKFRDCVEKVMLEDVAGKGCDFTWFRGATMTKLDRVMVNREWCSKYSRSYVVFEALGYLIIPLWLLWLKR
ncbi:hypothetical protein LIER_24278 [Lithospermum erythrorhizon]|uniref:Uncharacterized protein n=1 Tax=Lithospermum erythrorhizon TaxID=34254 RepID=A0AAV3R3T7_LITER